MKQYRVWKRIASVILLMALTLALVRGCSGAGKKQNPAAAQETAVQETTAQGTTTTKTQGTAERETTTAAKAGTVTEAAQPETLKITEDGEYTAARDVAEYLNLFGHLPDNYITKNEAKDLGWVSSRGNLWDVAPGKCIGGDSFGNREGLLPEKKGRKYYECDVNYEGGYRGDDRIIFSNDGMIYFTGDHYNSFDLLYGKED